MTTSASADDAVRAYLGARTSEWGSIDPERRARLADLAGLLRRARERHGEARVVFVCTHNSRRSQLAQVWMSVACDVLGVPGVASFSAGSEVTRVHPSVLSALRAAGISTREVSNGPNPIAEVELPSRGASGDEFTPLRLFSKRLDDGTNPSAGFVAVTVCADADAACPVVPGADARAHLPYRDPKVADGTPEQARVYAERSAEIAREMSFVATRLLHGVAG